MSVARIRLRVMLPSKLLVDQPAAKVVACAANGWFCLLPRHADFVTALVPGILVYTEPDGGERFVACDEGLLVKVGDDVLVSTPNGMIGDDLASLQRAVDVELIEIDEEAQRARGALARLEASTIRSFIEMERGGRV